MTTDIIPLAKDDFEDWLPLWRDYQAFYKADLAEETTRLSYSRLTGGQEPMGGFIARSGSQAVGIVHWIIHRSSWRSGDSCYLEDVYVAQDARGGGVGRKLMEALIAPIARPADTSRCWRA